MFLAIVGSRDFTDYRVFCRFVQQALEKWQSVPQKIISGGARGADTLAKKWATERGIPIVEHFPEWDNLGLSAGPVRNRKIVEEATHMIAFPSRTGKGTQNSMELAHKKGIPVKSLYVD